MFRIEPWNDGYYIWNTEKRDHLWHDGAYHGGV